MAPLRAVLLPAMAVCGQRGPQAQKCNFCGLGHKRGNNNWKVSIKALMELAKLLIVSKIKRDLPNRLIFKEEYQTIYREIGLKYGVNYSENEILNRYRRAYEQPWGRSRLRYVNDGRPFWQYIVSSSTGCSDSQYFEELYNYYTTEQAWHLCDPDAEKVFKALRKAGVKLAVVSNFDTRLRPVLQALHCDYWFDAVAVSAEVAAEKPNPTIFLKACELLGVKPEDAVHVGDDRRNDIWGARDAGCDAWLWGSDVHSFKEVAERIGVKV
ncbi:uncharacterized protein LOC126678353 [Mercurialis annua]|uniref:uncharacterized protein LOC126678353 n=1 Tax=Mercurialis annua TaxID=3986 RepID=UPI00215EF904|nr:uncharacterized protein LOC126678353 [Mercurialis annua]